MGLITNAAIIVSSTTLVGYCALRHVKTIVKEIPIPTSSILFHHFQTTKLDSPERWHSADAFEAKLPPHLPLQQDNSDVNTYVKLFYSSMVFKAEKTIMRTVFKQPEPDLSNFYVGHTVYVWKVVDRNDQEVLMAWQVGSVKGSTWFCIPKNKGTILFGSYIQTPKTHKDDNHLTKEANFSFTQKLVSVFSAVIWPIVLSFHETYSVILLYGVSRKFSKHIQALQT